MSIRRTIFLRLYFAIDMSRTIDISWNIFEILWHGLFVFGINLGDIPVLNHSQNKLKFMQTYWPYGLYFVVLVKIYIAHYVFKNYISGKNFCKTTFDLIYN